MIETVLLRTVYEAPHERRYEANHNYCNISCAHPPTVAVAEATLYRKVDPDFRFSLFEQYGDAVALRLFGNWSVMVRGEANLRRVYEKQTPLCGGQIFGKIHEHRGG